MRIISIINTKGGCGKTTTAINLACSLGWKGYRVLLIDMDSQGHATLGVNYKCDKDLGLYELFTEQTSIEEIILKFVVAGIDMIPANHTLENIETLSKNSHWKGNFEDSLNKISYLYDYVVIDCAAMLNYRTKISMLVSNEVIVPLEMSLFSIESLKYVIAKISEFEKIKGEKIPYSLLPTMVDQRTKLTRRFLNELWTLYPKNVLPFTIHNTVRIREAICVGVPIIDYDADSPAATDYMYLADEMLSHDTIEPCENNEFNEVKIVA